MNKILARGTAAAGGAFALLVLFGSGSAGAVNEYEGQTYGDASSAISNSGARPVIATRVGEYLPLGQCLVTGSRNSNSYRYGQAGTSTVLLDINCGYPFAYNGHPGFSRQSQEGGSAYQQALEAAQQQQQQQEEAAAAAAAAGDGSGAGGG